MLQPPLLDSVLSSSGLLMRINLHSNVVPHGSLAAGSKPCSHVTSRNATAINLHPSGQQS